MTPPPVPRTAHRCSRLASTPCRARAASLLVVGLALTAGLAGCGEGSDSAPPIPLPAGGAAAGKADGVANGPASGFGRCDDQDRPVLSTGPCRDDTCPTLASTCYFDYPEDDAHACGCTERHHAFCGSDVPDLPIVHQGNCATLVCRSTDLLCLISLGSANGAWCGCASTGQEPEAKPAAPTWDLPRGVLGFFGTGAADLWALTATGPRHLDGQTHTDKLGYRTPWGEVAWAYPAQVPVVAWGSSASDLWIGTRAQGGGDGVLVHVEHGRLSWGRPWTDRPRPFLDAPGSVRDLWGTSAGDVWAATDRGVFHFDGSRWSRVSNAGATGVSGSASDDVWLATGTSPTHWDGQTFTAAPGVFPPGLTAVAVVASDDVWLAGSGNQIFHFDGESWSGSVLPGADGGTSITIRRVWARTADDVWVVGKLETSFSGQSTYGYVAHWDGTGWTKLEAGTKSEITGVQGGLDPIWPDLVILTSADGLARTSSRP